MSINHHSALEDKLRRHFAKLRRSGNGWSVPCPAHHDHHPSLSIGIGRDGRLLLHCFVGCSFQEILAAADSSSADLRDLQVSDHHRTSPQPRSGEDRLAIARRIWLSTVPLEGTIAQRYLQNRGIRIAPPSLRFARLRSSEIRERRLQFPALVAGVQDVDGHFAGIQVTYLAADGGEKAPLLEISRRSFGPIRGGAVRLGPVANTICLSEGTETGLSIAQSCPGLSVWATLGTSGLGAVELPESVHEVTIAADADGPGMHAAESARRRFLCEGRRVRIILPPVGNDFNEALL